MRIYKDMLKTSVIIRNNFSQKYKHTHPRLLLQGWTALSNEQPLIIIAARQGGFIVP